MKFVDSAVCLTVVNECKLYAMIVPVLVTLKYRAASIYPDNFYPNNFNLNKVLIFSIPYWVESNTS